MVFLLSGCHVQLPPEFISEPRFHLYAYGETVRFGLGGDSHRFRLGGWSNTEHDFTWTNGIGASLLLYVPRTNRDVTLEMKLSPCLHSPDVPVQPVHVTVNGRKIVSWDVIESKIYKVTVPHDLIAARPGAVPGRPNLRDSVVLVFDFFIPKAQFPALIGTGPDWRRLGVACSELGLREGAVVQRPDAKLNLPRGVRSTAYTLGTLISFGAGENGARYKQSGWNTAEASSTWTGRGPAVMKLKLGKPKRPLTVKLKANGNILPPRLLTQRTLVYANRQQIAEWHVDELQDYTAEIPVDVIGPDGTLILEFESENATSPQQLGVNSDSRTLGIACYALIIAESDE